ncbi:FHA domain-containing protein [Kribbella qitaiheensis]|uniref:FHA domain-containing protein n=1 Tax=Kribbella qitaiheensis TaxID=1544730 RepID=A0A7G6WU20_9ACTN|nr:FHA domain-containing protein [Kribbella qitaiheensis]
MTSTGLEATRPSDAERDRALAILREGAGAGRLSHDTFIRRMNFVLGAQTRSELAHATRDLQGPEPKVVQVFRQLVTRVHQLTGSLRTSAPAPGLALPLPGSPTLRVGRGDGATLRLTDVSVSRFHAELRHVGDGWMVRDLNSMNGTHVNGTRITGPTRVRPGDRLQFGAIPFTLTSPDSR